MKKRSNRQATIKFWLNNNLNAQKFSKYPRQKYRSPVKHLDRRIQYTFAPRDCHSDLWRTSIRARPIPGRSPVVVQVVWTPRLSVSLGNRTFVTPKEVRVLWLFGPKLFSVRVCRIRKISVWRNYRRHQSSNYRRPTKFHWIPFVFRSLWRALISVGWISSRVGLAKIRQYGWLNLCNKKILWKIRRYNCKMFLKIPTIELNWLKFRYNGIKS